ncbi:MAG: N-acetyltransferase [Methylocystaceae bacterium]|nr:N-acetyltransferase [Methylocystaceae bacterium]
MIIRAATPNDLTALLDIHRLAFEEDDEADLVASLLKDQTAVPVLSLIAEDEGEVIGHILFTKAKLKDLNAYLLAPLAVLPERQFKGTGRRLIKEGLRQLNAWNVDLVFVLGDPLYYQQSGFEVNAGRLGFIAPHPIPKKHADAWMVKNLSHTDVIGAVQVADAISAKEYWSD